MECGYICKKCGGPSPVGLGYVSHVAGAADASAGRSACGCGYSVAARDWDGSILPRPAQGIYSGPVRRPADTWIDVIAVGFDDAG